MKKFTSTKEAIRHFEGKGYRISTTPANVVVECEIKYGICPTYLINAQSGDELFIVDGEPIAAIHHFSDGLVSIDLP